MKLNEQQLKFVLYVASYLVTGGLFFALWLLANLPVYGSLLIAAVTTLVLLILINLGVPKIAKTGADE